MERRAFIRLVSAGGAFLGGLGTTACGQGCAVKTPASNVGEQ